MDYKKYFTLSYLLNFFEDPKYPSLGPHLRLLGLTGLWHPKKMILKQCLFYITISFFISQYLKCAIKLQPSALKLILQYTPFHLGIVKVCFFKKNYKEWESIITYVTSVEHNQKDHGNRRQLQIMANYIKQSRRITYFFWALAFFSNFTIFTEPYQKNQTNINGTSNYLKLFDGYTPFSDEPPGYYISMTIQTTFGYIMSAYVVGWDMLVCTIMIFFAGQLQISRLMCTNIIEVKDVKRTHIRIAECHRFHVSLIENQKLFNSLISPAMFVYLIVSSVNLGVCIKEIVQLKGDLQTFISSCLFVMACLIQLLLFYWHSDEVTYQSTLVSYGAFESRWTETNSRSQQEVALLGLTTTKRLVFKAGPFNEMSLSTFVAILRLSYSFYTLLSETIG